MKKSSPTVSPDRHQLRQIVAGLDSGVILIERDRRISWANASACAMHGITTHAGLGQTIGEYRKRFELRYRNHHKVPAAAYPLERALKGETFSDVVVEVTAVARPDVSRVLRTRSLVITDTNGKPDCYALFAVDVTDWASAEQRFEKAFNTNPAPGLICRLEDLRYIKVNRGFLEMTGYASEEVIGRSIYELDVLENAENREAAIEHLVAGETIAQTQAELRVSGGGSKIIVVAGQPIEVADEACMLLTFIDLESRRTIEEALRQSEERFAKAFRMTPVPSLVCSADRLEISDANAALAAAIGYTPEDMIGRSIDALGLLDSGAARKQVIGLLRETGSLSNVECVIKRADGQTIDCLVSAETVPMNGSSCLLVALLDITYRKRSELELVEAVEEVMRDASWFSRPLIERLANVRRGASMASAPELSDLTDRERDVLALIGEGLTDKAIAARLNVSPSTVRNHAASIYSKLDVHNRGAAILWARERGFTSKSQWHDRRTPGNGSTGNGSKGRTTSDGQ